MKATRTKALALALAAVTLSCQNPVATSTLDLQLTAQLGKQEFSEDEPIYVVFTLTNHSSDTAWIAPFDLPGWFLDGEMNDTAGKPVPDWGFIADYLFPPAYRGDPVPPGHRIYAVTLLQARWGFNRPELQDLYSGHHIPVGDYALRMRFSYEVPQAKSTSRVVYAEPVTFRILQRNADQEQAFQALQRLAAMLTSIDQRPAYLDSVVVSVARRSADDPLLPLIVGQFVGIARLLGYPPDSAEIDQLALVSIAASRAQRATAGGATAVLAANSYRPAVMKALAEELTGSLAGDVASSIVARQ